MRKGLCVLAGRLRNLKPVLPAFAVLICVLALAAPMFSQTANGRILGSVKDQTGGAIVGATVTVTDTARGLTRTLTTDDAGAYLAPNLIPGNYTVHATFTGFQAWERTNVALGVGQDIAIDIVLQPGAQTQTVTITEEVPLVNTTSAVLGGTLSGQTITDLPISGRNYVNLLQLRPGTVLELGNNSNGGGSAATNGLREENSNTYAIEGLSGMDPYTGQSVTNLIGVNGDAATLLPLDAIQEFNQQFNSKAEYGSKAGSNVAVGLKSGTNALHGTAYSFFRTSATDAKNYYNPYDTVNGAKTPIDIGAGLWQPGVTVGGPIVKDKMFFFAGYEQEHLDVGSPTSIQAFFTDPSMLNCTGVNATYNCTPKAGLFPNILGGTAVPDLSNDVTLSCLALRNAGVTPSAQSLFMLGMDQYCQLPGGTSASGVPFAAGQVNPDFFVNHGANDHGAQGPNNATINTFFANNTTTVQALGGVAKYDYTINDKNSLNAFVYQGRGERYDGLGSQPSERYETDFLQFASMYAGTWTYLPNSVMANSFRIGYSTLNEPNYALDEEQGLTAGQLGMNTGVTRFGQLGVGQALTPAGFYAIGSRESDFQGTGRSLEINDALSYLIGKHSLKIGASVMHDGQDDAINAFGKGTFGFGEASSSSASTSGLVSFLLGQQGIPGVVAGGSSVQLSLPGGVNPITVAANGSSVNGITENTGLQSAELLYGNPYLHVHRYDFSWFVQDDWRIKPRLTVNLGLRYDYSTPIRSTNTVMGSFNPNYAGGLVQEGIQTPTIYNSPSHNFGPRIGFAYDLFGDGKTVLRAGGGIVYDLITLRSYLEVGNNQGLGGVPTGWITGCSGTLLAAIPAGATNNCTGQLTTPGGTREVGQIAWAAGSGNILGNVLWDSSPVVVGGIQTGRSSTAQTIFPNPNGAASLNCNPFIMTATAPGAPAISGASCEIPAIDPNLTTPYVETWSFGIQHQIVNNILLDVAYVGNHGVSLLDKRNLNQAADFAGWTSAVGQGLLATCLQQEIAGKCKTPDSAINSTTAGTLRPYWNQFPWMNDIQEVVNGDTSNYDGLQTSLTLRNYHGVSAIAGYTWSHSLSIQDNNNGGFETDSHNLALDYGAAGSDVRHRFSIAPTYALPGVKGFDGILDGWKLNGTFIFQSGRPLSFTTSSSTSDFAGMANTSGSTYRWNLTGSASDFTPDYAANVGLVRDPKLAQYWPGCGTNFATDPTCANLIYTSAAAKTTAQTGVVGTTNINARTGLPFALADMAISNPACVAATGGNAGQMATLRAFGCWTEGSSVLTPPALGTFGDSTKGEFRGPSFWQADASIVKRQKITERFSGEFRFEVFNFLNHPNFNNPSTSIGTSCTAASCAFQSISSTPDVAATNPIIGAGGPRRMQFGVKVIF